MQVQTQQIGSRLVREFSNGYTIVTETLKKGHTLTKVLDCEGKTISERLKVVSAPVLVGDKFIRRTQRIVSDVINDNVIQNTADRVYTSDGKYLGSREVIKSQDFPTEKLLEVMKEDGTKDVRVITYRSDGIIDSKIHYSGVTGMPRGSYHRNLRSINYFDRKEPKINDKGLLAPDAYNDLSWDSEMSIKEMRAKLQAEFPSQRYTTTWPGMESLDERVDAEKANHLYDFLA